MQAVLRPVAQPQGGRHVLFEHFWVEMGDLPLPEPSSAPQFVMTPSVRGHLRSLARAVLVRRFPILLQASAAAASRTLPQPVHAASARALPDGVWLDAIRHGLASLCDVCFVKKYSHSGDPGPSQVLEGFLTPDSAASVRRRHLVGYHS